MRGYKARPIEYLGAVKVFTLPSCAEGVIVYGPEIGVIGSEAFQRLGGIRQLGTSYVAYRGAMHTRFEHSLGTLHMAEKMVQAARRNPAREAKEEFDPQGHRLARLAALLHDVTHVPFGHTLEDEFGLLARHDENEFRIKTFFGPGTELAALLQPVLGKREYAELISVLKAKPDAIPDLDRPYLADIMGNTVCADILDYVRRDLDACGMEVAIGERFLDYFTVTSREVPDKANRSRMALILDKRGMPRPDVESEVVKLLTFRYELAERVYFHHSKNSASAMIARAVQVLGLATGPELDADGKIIRWDEAEDANFHHLSDDLLLRVLATPALGEILGLTMRDDLTADERASVVDLGKSVLGHRLYKLAYLGVRDDLLHRATSLYGEHGKPHARMALENRLAALAGLPAGRVLVHLPRPQMMRKRADVRVLLADRQTVTTLNEWDELHSRRIQSLNSAHERLWRVSVYLHPDEAENSAVRLLVQAAAEEAFGAQSRYQVEGRSPYMAAVWDASIREHEDWEAEARTDVLRDLSTQKPAAWSGIASFEDAVDLLDRMVQDRRKAQSPETSAKRRAPR